MIDALRSFGAPLQDLTEADLTRAGTVFQIGVAPIRIDVLTSIDGVGFEDAWSARLAAHFMDLHVPVLSANHLIANKRTVGRPQDLADIDWLEKRSR